MTDVKTKFEERGVPTPGSARAVDQGCECAVMDNSRGAGMMYNGERVFWITVGCPLHAPVEDLDVL